MTRPRPEVQFQAFGESELQFVLLTWLSTPDISLRRRVLSDMNSSIDAAFRRCGIEIPFPQRDLHMRTMPERALEAGPPEALPEPEAGA